MNKDELKSFWGEKKQEERTNLYSGNDLNSLNNYLFDELERLSNINTLDEKSLIKEINRSKAVSSIATNIINNANVVIEANKLFSKSSNVPELLGITKK